MGTFFAGRSSIHRRWKHTPSSTARMSSLLPVFRRMLKNIPAAAGSSKGQRLPWSQGVKSTPPDPGGTRATVSVR